MNNDTDNNPITMILFNDRASKTFTHTKEFKRLLGTSKIKVFPKKGKIYETVEILESSLFAKSIVNPGSYDHQFPMFDCTHLIGIPASVNRNEFFDFAYSENIVGSFTSSFNELVYLEELNSRFFESLYIHRSPLRWLRDAENNVKSYEHNNFVDPTVTNFNIHYLKRVSETYGLQAINDCQSKITKWIKDHRWRYID